MTLIDYHLSDKPSIQLLQAARQSGTIQDPQGRNIPFEDQLDEDAYAALYEVIRAMQPETVLELGFAHGCATLYMLQALSDNQKGALISVDPLQAAQYHSGGIKNVERAGFSKIHQHLNGPSQIVLPQLLLKNFRYEFIFIDTTHQFDQTIMELYFCDKLLPVGGVVALHDYQLLSIRSACNFFESNLNYRLHASHRANLRILQKTANDSRKWYDFVPFEVPKDNQALAILHADRHKVE
ncbi:MAG: class I SAM-dependent methyltransferase [Desulfobacteraceae bacterium]|nr:class I SAM-dependent methyltransferase [Desulfobacteraceae bacterium]